MEQKEGEHARVLGELMSVHARILLAEPDTELRTAIARALRADGHAVEEAADGADLLLRAGSQMACVDGPRRVPVLVVAAGLPVFSASEVLEILHRFRWDIPCIVISRAPDGVEHTRARELGALAVLGSPLRIEQLRGIVRAQRAPARRVGTMRSPAPARALYLSMR